MFKPIDKLENVQANRYYELIIETIRTMMINGDLVAGGKLPSERELAEMLNVSRVPVREALKVLEFMGVVQNVRGEGMYIRNIDFIDLIDKLDFAIESTEDTLEELFELREALETMAVKLAAERRTKKDIQNMKKAIIDMEKGIALGVDIYDTSYDFHSSIIMATKNKIFYSVYESLNEFLKLSRAATLSQKERLEETLSDHKKILEKIIEQDKEGAMLAMQEHLIKARHSIH